MKKYRGFWKAKNIYIYINALKFEIKQTTLKVFSPRNVFIET